MLFLYYDILLHSINHVSMMLSSVQLILQHNIPTVSRWWEQNGFIVVLHCTVAYLPPYTERHLITHSSMYRPNIICVYTCYCRPYKSIVCFFSWLALVQDVSGGVQTHFEFYCARFEAVMNINIHYIAKTCITWIQSVSGHHPTFCKKKMDQTKGKQRKKRNK
jgi:hypothetical protein